MLVSHARTFNPLVLGEGELYVTDFAVQHGRLRLGTKSLLFEPDSSDDPIAIFKFRNLLLVKT